MHFEDNELDRLEFLAKNGVVDPPDMLTLIKQVRELKEQVPLIHWYPAIPYHMFGNVIGMILATTDPDKITCQECVRIHKGEHTLRYGCSKVLELHRIKTIGI